MPRPSTMLMGQRVGVMKPFGSMLWGHEIWRLPRPHTGPRCSICGGTACLTGQVGGHTMSMIAPFPCASMAPASWPGRRRSGLIIRDTTSSAPPGSTIPSDAIFRKQCVASDQFGSPTYAPHLAEAIFHLIGTEAYGTYHLVGKGETSWFELAERFTASWGFRHPSDRSQVWPLRELLCAPGIPCSPACRRR